MLTHTWILRQLTGHIDHHDMDIFCYNAAPDMLSIHTGITSDITHRIPRILHLPDEHRKGAFVLFHLMVDDIAHHGRISPKPITDFNPDAQGYTYRKGAVLIPRFVELYKENRIKLSRCDAAYRSHILIEAAFDLVLCQAEGPQGLIDLQVESLDFVVRHRIEEFSATLAWLCGVERERIASAIRQGHQLYTAERMNTFMSVEGRTVLFMDKFNLDRHDQKIWQGIYDIMVEGMAITRNYKEFLSLVAPAVRDAGFKPALKDIKPLS
jgi:hypothetical protein